MRRLKKWRFGLTAGAGAMALLVIQSCDPTTSGPDTMRSRWGDPPVIYTFLNDFNGKETAVRIEFPAYTTTVNVTNPPGFTFLRNMAKVKLPRFGGGAFPPDPDEFEFPDPWDFPPPEDDFPDPPDFPLPDPWEDPYLGDPLPLPPGDEFDMTDFSPGTLNFASNGTPLGFRVKPGPFKAAITVQATLVVGPNAAGIVASPDWKTLYVAVGGNGAIAVIDRAGRAIKSRITLPAGTQPYALAITPDGTRLYTGEFQPSPAAIYSVDLPSGTAKKFPVSGSYISQAIVTPDGTQVWICSYFGNVQIFDVLTNSFVTALNISNPWNVAFNASGSRAYITNGATGVPGNVAVIDTETLKTIATIPVGVTPKGIRISPSGRHAFVVNYDSTFLSQIDVSTNKVIRNIEIGGSGASKLRFAHN